MRFSLPFLVIAIAALLTVSARAQEGLAWLPDGLAQAGRTGGISVTVRPGITGMNQIEDARLRAARRAMFAGEPVSDADLRALAELRDGLAAQRYVHRLAARDPVAGASDIAYFASIAVATGRIATLSDAVSAMRRLDPETEPPARLREYMAMLYPHAWAGNSLALEAVIEFNGEGRLFGPLSETTRARIVAQDRENGSGQVELRLALALLRAPERGVQQTAQARAHLERAAAQGNALAVRVTALNLLAQIDDGEGSS